METVFVLLEDGVRDGYRFGEETNDKTSWLVRGISPTLDGAISLVAVHRLTDVEWDESAWQIEEVPWDAPIRATNSPETCFGICGAIAMYDLDGTILRRSDMTIWPNWLELKSHSS